MPKAICLLGSTGSIGEGCLDVVRAHPGRFRIAALAAASRTKRILAQVDEFRPRRVAIADEAAAAAIAGELKRRGVTLVAGRDAAAELAAEPDADVVVNALVGAAGLLPTLRSLEAGIDVALANKESLVLGGALVMEMARRTGARILPIDSEHSALHQCLAGANPREVTRIVLTASGGPFLKHSKDELAGVTAEDSLRHPTWSMGPRVTVDSATLLNKGLEVIEAHWLFDVPIDSISVLVHPQSLVHAIVEFADGSCLAHMATADMRLPIQYALTYPERCPSLAPPLDLVAAGPLSFEPPDTERFPCLGLAYEAARAGGTAPACLNAADEVAVGAFLDGRIAFGDIPLILARVLGEESDAGALSFESIVAADGRSRRRAEALVGEGAGGGR